MTAGPDVLLPDARPTQDKDAALVQRMFDRVAARYDVANAVISFGSDQHWRRCTAAALGDLRGAQVLDVAAGTGRLAAALRDAGARVVALDFSMPMLAAGAALADRAGLGWVNGDGTRLPFADATFDAVAIGFGLRNLAGTVAGLRELRRVTRPGGRLAVLECSTPTWAPFRMVYRRYLLHLLPRVAAVVSSDAPAYRYLADSILAWPDQHGLARAIAGAGWQRPQWTNLSGGIMAIHRATAPAR